MSARAVTWAIKVGIDKRLHPTERLVLLHLALNHNQATGACFPAVATIAEAAGITSRQAQKVLQRLSGLGVITINTRSVHGRQTSNSYDLFGDVRGVLHDTRI